MQYRRSKTPGATYFFTINQAERNQPLLVSSINYLRDSFRKIKYNHPFRIDAISVLPEHVHAIFTLPEGDEDYATRLSLIKASFSRELPKTEKISTSRKKKGERGIWQRRFWEHQIRNDSDFENHVNYIHYNPVKHGYVKKVSDWPYSSFHQYVNLGILESDWGYDEKDQGSFGE